MTIAAVLIPLLAYASPTPDVVDLADRPYGKVMGDGLGLRLEPGPMAGAVCPPGETVFGIDVSYYQGDIDWNAVAADGVKYAIIRVSHSLEFFDPQFEANLAGARAAGIHAGAYQFFEPDEDPVAQADLLLDALGPLQPGDLPPMIDVESTAGQSPAAITAAIHAWIDRVESTLGVKPLLYSGYYFWNDNVGSTDFGEYPLMLPWYGVECPGGVNTGWDMWSIHQYCDCGTIAGISGPVDVDRFNGTLADLEALSFAPVCGDGSCTGAETPYTCAGDCPPCGEIQASGGTLDNGNACYALYGDAQYWREEAVGEGGSLVWTHATDLDQAYNYARWQLHFLEAGRYELEVHVQQPFGESKQAAYQVRYAGGEQTVMIDQSASDGWVSLGEFAFDAAADHTVQLGDNTGEADALEVQLVFDALRVTRVDLDPSTDDGDGGSQESEGGPAGSDDDSGGAVDGTEGAGPGGSETGIGDGGATGEDIGDGCGCRNAPSRGGVLALLGVFALVHPRRCRRAKPR
ncbi:MAG: hypothetical protein IAG13_06900 [Deltaproteobacteria bacterium]|nr:hypothetical protein [Nannocystaceae bacterium]